MMHVLALCPIPNDGTSWYRGIGPLIELKRQGFLDYKETTDGDELDWDTLLHFDVLFLQRPFRVDHKDIAIKAIRLGLKVWVDFDDWLFGIPVDNPVHDAYKDMDAEGNIKKILSNPNILVTCSTSYLAKLYQPFCASEIKVVNNGWNTRLFGKGVQSHGKIIGWRGSNTHVRDLVEYHTGISDFIDRYPQQNFEFIGYNPWFITEGKSNVEYKKPMDLINYHGYLGLRNKKAFFVCLADNDFNRAKSNIAWLEATWAGAVMIAPNWDEWKRPGVLNYSNDREFMDIMEDVITSDFKQTNWFISQNEVEENYCLSTMNGIRKTLLNKLTGK